MSRRASIVPKPRPIHSALRAFSSSSATRPRMSYSRNMVFLSAGTRSSDAMLVGFGFEGGDRHAGDGTVGAHQVALTQRFARGGRVHAQADGIESHVERVQGSPAVDV